MPSVGLYTLGCKVSQYETEAIGEAFEKNGFTVGDFADFHDVYVINTCTVTAESDRKSRQVIRRALRANPNAVVLVCGCYSQRSPETVAKIPGVTAVIGTANKLSLVDLAKRHLADRSAEQTVAVTDVDHEEFEPMCITHAPRTRAYVKIEDGCECRCTYCAISSARGRVRSKKPEEVIAEVEELYRNGTREVVLTGIETGSYGKDFETPYSLADLLCELDRRHSCDRIRLGSLAPELIDREFAERISGLLILAPHFHFSIQSGANAVLHKMRRRYSAEQAMANIERLREKIPGVMFTSDVMVGFPGETEEDFEETVAFVRRAKFLACHVFAYSRRKGTPADTMEGQIPESVKHERSEKLIAASAEVTEGLLAEIIREGRPLSCVFETGKAGLWSAHSASFIEVSVASEEPLHGEIRDVLPIGQKDGILIGKLI